jgi:hypothetical protein
MAYSGSALEIVIRRTFTTVLPPAAAPPIILGESCHALLSGSNRRPCSDSFLPSG